MLSLPYVDNELSVVSKFINLVKSFKYESLFKSVSNSLVSAFKLLSDDVNSKSIPKSKSNPKSKPVSNPKSKPVSKPKSNPKSKPKSVSVFCNIFLFIFLDLDFIDADDDADDADDADFVNCIFGLSIILAFPAVII